MNTNQTANLFTTLIQLALGALVSRGLITGSESESLGGALAALVVFFISHNWHSSPPSTSGGSKPGGGVLMVLLAAGLLAAAPGCQSSPQAVTYQAAATSTVTVQTALKAYDAFAAAGKTTPAQNAAVKAAYEKYQAAFALACDAGAAYSATGGTNGNTQAAVQVAFGNASQSLLDLENLIAAFGVKL